MQQPGDAALDVGGWAPADRSTPPIDPVCDRLIPPGRGWLRPTQCNSGEFADEEDACFPQVAMSSILGEHCGYHKVSRNKDTFSDNVRESEPMVSTHSQQTLGPWSHIRSSVQSAPHLNGDEDVDDSALLLSPLRLPCAMSPPAPPLRLSPPRGSDGYHTPRNRTPVTPEPATSPVCSRIGDWVEFGSCPPSSPLMTSQPRSPAVEPIDATPKAPFSPDRFCVRSPFMQPRKRTLRSTKRTVPTSAYKILDAPGMVDDYYVRLLDWGSSNLVCVALGDTVYVWNPKTSAVSRMCGFRQGQLVTSVCFNSPGTRVAVGILAGPVHIFDVGTGKHIGMTLNHNKRVGALAYRGDMLASGAADGSICTTDTRTHGRAVQVFESHTNEVCALSWSPCDTYLASGAGDNKVCVWSLTRTQRPQIELRHEAAVKGLAWSPHRAGQLATGGGTGDGVLKLHSLPTGKTLYEQATGSQICGLVWSKHSSEIVTSHGYAVESENVEPSLPATRNTVSLWNTGSQGFQHVASLQGHVNRALHLTASPDGTRVASASPDETVRFWDVFAPVKRTPAVRPVPDPCMLR